MSLVSFYTGFRIDLPEVKAASTPVKDARLLISITKEERVLFGFWRGQRLRLIEPRLKPGGKFEMATVEIRYPALEGQSFRNQ